MYLFPVAFLVRWARQQVNCQGTSFSNLIDPMLRINENYLLSNMTFFSSFSFLKTTSLEQHSCFHLPQLTNKQFRGCKRRWNTYDSVSALGFRTPPMVLMEERCPLASAVHVKAGLCWAGRRPPHRLTVWYHLLYWRGV